MTDHIKYLLSPAILGLHGYGMWLGGNFAWLGLGLLLAVLFFDAFLENDYRMRTSSHYWLYDLITASTMVMGVLMIAILLRFMDSFMIYTEPFVVTGGGPGNATTLLSIDLVKMALGQFDLGPAAAFSLMYFLVILAISWVFYTVMINLDKKGM